VKNDFSTSNLVSGHEATATVAGSQTDVGVSSNVVSQAVVLDGQNNDVTANYEFTYVDGELKVTPAEMAITIAGTPSTAVYTGAAQTTNVAWTATSESDGFDAAKVAYNGAATVSGTDAGSYAYELDATKFVYDDANYTATFTLSADGAFTITPASITITVAGTASSAVYNGAEQTGTVAYTLASADALYDASKVAFSGDATVAGTTVGDYAYGLEAADFAYNDDNITATFEVTDANFSITAAIVDIPAAPGNKVYNGQNQTADVTAPATVEVTNDGGKDAGDYTVTFALKDTANYTWSDGSTTNQTFGWSIAQKALKLIAEDKEVAHGAAAPAYSYKVDETDGLVEGDSLATEPTLSCAYAAGDAVGTYTIEISGAVAPNYAITYANGTLTVVSNTFTVIWLADDGTTEIDTTQVEWGETPTHADATKTDATGKYEYKFAAWMPAPGPVTEATNFVASFTQSIATPLELPLANHAVDATVNGSTASVALSPVGAIDGIAFSASPATATLDDATGSLSFSGLDWNEAVAWSVSAAQGEAELAETTSNSGKFYVKPETAWFTAAASELVAVADTSDAAVGYTPAAASPEGEMVRVHTTVNVPAGGLPQAPETGEAKTGFAVLQLDGDTAPAFYAFGNGAWTKLAGVEPEQGEADFYAVYDLGAETPTARYYVNGVALYAAGEGGAKVYALPLASGTTSLKSVSFASADMVAGDIAAEYDTSYVAAVDQTPYTEIDAALAAAGTAGEKTLALLKAGVPLDPAVSLGSGEKLVVDYAKGTFTNEVPVVSGVTGYDVKVTEADTVKTYELDPIVYPISYVLDGGDNAASNTNEYTVATLPVVLADATRTGYTFGGWTNNLSANAVVTSIPVGTTGEVVNVALWTVNEYDLVFDADGGETVATRKVAYGADPKVTETTTKTGYTFVEWQGVPATMPAESVTVKAKWTPALVDYTVKHLQQSVDGQSYVEVEADRETLQGYTEAQTEAVAKTYAGFKAGVVTQVEILPDGTAVAEVKYDRDTFTITFVTGGGTEIAPIEAVFGAAVTAPADPTKDGFLFKGWDKAIPETMPAENLTITAQWDEVKATVITVAQDGTTTETGYASLEEAIEAAGAGATVRLEGDVSEAVAGIDKPVTLDLNGHTWTVPTERDEEGYLTTEPIAITAAVTVTDSSENGGGSIESIASPAVTVAGTGASLTVEEGATIASTDGEGGFDGDAVEVGDGGSVVVDGGTVKGTVAVAENATGAGVTVKDGSVDEIYVNDGATATVAVTGGEVVDGIIAVDDDQTAGATAATVTVAGGSVGGGVQIPAGSTLEVSDGTVNGISGEGDVTVAGGTINDGILSAGTVTVTGGTVNARESVGGVTPPAIVAGGTATISGGTVAGDVKAIAGGDVAISAPATVTGGVSAAGEGSTVAISGGTVGGTLAAGEGDGSSVSVTGGHFAEDPSDFVADGYVAVAGDPSGYDVIERKSLDGATITIADATYTGAAQTPAPTVTVKVDDTDETLTLGTDFVAVYATNALVDAGTYDVSIVGIGEWIGTAPAQFTIAKAVLTVTADNLTVPFRTPVADVAYTFTYTGFVNGETADVIGTAPTATSAYTADTAAGTKLDITVDVSQAVAANYTFVAAETQGVLTVGAAEAPTILGTTSITVAQSTVTLQHVLQTGAKYYTYFTCTDLAKGEWVAAENSRAAESITPETVKDADGDDHEGTTVIFNGVSDDVRFYQVGYSSVPYASGDAMGEKPAGGEEP